MATIKDPVLLPREGSEIEAAIDVSIGEVDGVNRPFFICQETEIMQITLADAIRLRNFLTKAIKYVEEFNDRSVQ